MRVRACPSDARDDQTNSTERTVPGDPKTGWRMARSERVRVCAQLGVVGTAELRTAGALRTTTRGMGSFPTVCCCRGD